MSDYSRREFLRMGAVLAAGFGLGETAATAMADGLQKIFEKQKRVLWLQAQSCSGCSVSLLNSAQPDIAAVLTKMISLVFHPTVSAAQGDVAMAAVQQAVKDGNYLLVLEGSIPGGMPQACQMGHETMGAMLPDIMRRSDGVVAIGTCAAYGGIPAAEGNPTGAMSVQAFMERFNIPTEGRLINCPGCPTHPQSIVGTLSYVAAKGYPLVNAKDFTPRMFYKNSVHDDCPRFHYWQKQLFAEKLGQEGCLFKLGCLGPLTHTECPRRQWNGGVNWCIRAGAPCIACTSEGFAKQRSFPFYRMGEAYHEVAYSEQERKGNTI